jgi:glycosyltransferase involved in cell wall biosynthesis
MILFLGPLPEPVTGHSLACRVLLDALESREPVDVVDLKKSDFRQGFSSFGRIGEVLGMVFKIAKRQRRAGLIYFTISESVAGNLKDLLIFTVCASQLRNMVIHLHGGAGMKKIMDGKVPVLAAVNRFFLRRLGGVIVLGPRHREIYSSFIDANHLHEAPNFAEDHLFLSDTSIAEKFQNTRPLRILFLSNLLPGKGHLELIEAIRKLDASERDQIHLDVAGGFEDEQQRQDFQDSIKDLKQVHYHGTVHGTKKQRLFADAHVFCLPTYYGYEGQPISILEAYASGCAVMTTDHSGIFDIFEDGKNGYSVEKGSSDSLARALRQILLDGTALATFALENSSEAREKYTVEHFNARLLDILDGFRVKQKEISHG